MRLSTLCTLAILALIPAACGDTAGPLLVPPGPGGPTDDAVGSMDTLPSADTDLTPPDGSTGPADDAAGEGDATVSPVDPALCGNGMCDLGETEAGCPEDCAPAEVVCGDGSCDVGETCGTCPDDCTLCGLSCWDVRACVNGCGDSACKFQCLADTAAGDVLSACLSGCGTDACFDDCFSESEDPETVLYGAYNACYNACDTDPTCGPETCMPVKLDCLSGAIYGVGGCYDFLVCFNDCPDGAADTSCDRACAQASTKAGLQTFYTLNDCVAAACPTFASDCIGAAVDTGGACAAEVAACN